ncbi:Homeobox domain [Trinorchestia longiramus]|nr:Homeobox domain [Trinorchestia longiramus]
MHSAEMDQQFVSGSETESSSSSQSKRKVQKVYPLQTVPHSFYEINAHESWQVEGAEKFSRSRSGSSCASSSSDVNFNPYEKAFESTTTDTFYSSPERSSSSPTSSPFYDSGVSETASPPRNDLTKCRQNSNFDGANSTNKDPCGMEYLVVDALTDEDVTKTESDPGHEKKKKKKRRVLFTKLQTRELERRFYSSYYISPQERDALAKDLNMDPDQVKIWFQNHRYKLKKYHKENSDRGLAPTLPYFRGGPYPMLLRDVRRPELVKDSFYYDLAKEHALGDYIKDPRIFDAAKSLNPALFSTPGHQKQVMALNGIIPAYSTPIMPFAHPYPYDLSYSNYYLNSGSTLLAQNPLTSGPLNQSLTNPRVSLSGGPTALYNNPLHLVFSKPVV